MKEGPEGQQSASASEETFATGMKRGESAEHGKLSCPRSHHRRTSDDALEIGRSQGSRTAEHREGAVLLQAARGLLRVLLEDIQKKRAQAWDIDRDQAVPDAERQRASPRMPPFAVDVHEPQKVLHDALR